jgi:hypothetical protein
LNDKNLNDKKRTQWVYSGLNDKKRTQWVHSGGLFVVSARTNKSHHHHKLNTSDTCLDNFKCGSGHTRLFKNDALFSATMDVFVQLHPHSLHTPKSFIIVIGSEVEPAGET